jgi:ornithine cyclodeaminase/alanine dehydrogenase-like protein (mu-crystallin family)
MANIRILGAAEVRQALPMVEAIQGMKEAYAQLSAGKATVPLRGRVDLPDYNGISLFMPAYLSQSDDLAVKIVTVYPDNIRRAEPVIYATVLLLDAPTGRPLALLEGGALTAIRTGAGSGAATDLLARSDAHTVAIFGSGVQARTQLEAVCTVRDIRSVRVYSINREQAEEFARSLAGKGPIPDQIMVAGTPAEAIIGADIVCTATTSHKPVFAGRDLLPGTHVNAIGAFTPEMQEVDVDTIRRSMVVVDSREAVMEEAGDLLIPLAAGVIDAGHIQTELGEIVLGLKPGRTDRDQITYFKSVGVAVQDAVAGRIALRNAIAANLGTVVSL